MAIKKTKKSTVKPAAKKAATPKAAAPVAAAPVCACSGNCGCRCRVFKKLVFFVIAFALGFATCCFTCCDKKDGFRKFGMKRHSMGMKAKIFDEKGCLNMEKIQGKFSEEHMARIVSVADAEGCVTKDAFKSTFPKRDRDMDRDDD